jgi:hypothetical protein
LLVVVPTFTLPNARLVGLTVSWGAVVDEPPLPVSATELDPELAFEVTVTVPLKFPDAFGAK